MDVSPYQLTMEQNLARLMQPKPTLDPRLFDENNLLLPDIRLKLLHRARTFFQLCVAPYQTFEIVDIVICGSADSYFYNDNSDIDMKIVMAYCPQEPVFANAGDALTFLKQRVRVVMGERRLRVNGRFVDIQLTLKAQERQLYSVLQNRWLVEPSPHIMEGIDAAKVLADAQEYLRQMKKLITAEFERRNGKFALEDLEKMRDLFNRLVKSKSTSVHNLLVHKLLGYSGILRDFQNFYQSQIAYTLSF